MPELTPQALNWLLMLALCLLVPGLLLALSIVARARGKVGRVIAFDRPGRTRRLLIFAGTPLVVLALVAWQRELPLAAATACLGVSCAIALLLPGFQDAVCGESGVQRGFHARGFEELEEWRLAGEHLRFRLFGEWTSVPLPFDQQAPIRAHLTRVVPERESQFKD